MGGVGDGFEWHLRGCRGQDAPPLDHEGLGWEHLSGGTLLERHLSWVASRVRVKKGAHGWKDMVSLSGWLGHGQVQCHIAFTFVDKYFP